MSVCCLGTMLVIFRHIDRLYTSADAVRPQMCAVVFGSACNIQDASSDDSHQL